MKIAIATVQVPFIAGGAELQTRGLRDALVEAGHIAEIVTMPFRFSPPQAVEQAMDGWAEQDFESLDGGPVDTVISLRFPAIYLKHPNKRVWLMHQHRSVYELFGTPYGESETDEKARALRKSITERDTQALRNAKAVFTTSAEVSSRMLRFNGVHSTPILHPPAKAERFESGECYPYIFFPSRLETLKRQDLLIEAMAHVKAPVVAVLAGDGGQTQALHRLVGDRGLDSRVKFLGRIDDATMISYYRHALGVFFGPFLEDYGYITLEAMLAERSVITCTDSGGATHFVRHGETGFVTEPRPEAVADAIDRLWADRSGAARMGRQGRELYDSLNISWDHVVRCLLTN